MSLELKSSSLWTTRPSSFWSWPLSPHSTQLWYPSREADPKLPPVWGSPANNHGMIMGNHGGWVNGWWSCWVNGANDDWKWLRNGCHGWWCFKMLYQWLLNDSCELLFIMRRCPWNGHYEFAQINRTSTAWWLWPQPQKPQPNFSIPLAGSSICPHRVMSPT